MACSPGCRHRRIDLVIAVQSQDQGHGLSGLYSIAMQLAAFTSWLVALPLAVWIGNRLAARSPRRKWVPWIVAALLTVWTMVIIWPRAPDGSDHSEHLAEGKAILDRELHEVFDAVYPDQWKMTWLNDGQGLGPCRDGFGRERGAFRSEVSITMNPNLDTSRLSRFVEVLEAQGWSVEQTEVTVGEGRTDTRVLAEKDGYGIGVLPWRATTPPGANTPCLRP